MGDIKFYWSPMYRARRDNWVKHRDTYDAERSVILSPTYLIKHEQEEPDNAEARAMRRKREERTRFLNIQKIIVSLWQSLFFREQITFTDKDRAMLGEECIANIDGKGNSIQSLMVEKVTPNYLNFGASNLLVDAFGTSVQSLAQEKASGIRPFMDSVHPLSVPDWDIESADPKRLGKLNLWRQQYQYQAPRAALWEPPTLDLRTDVYIHTANGFRIMRFKAKQALEEALKLREDEIQWETISDRAGAIDVPLPEIPVSRILQEDWVYDVVEENLRHYNLRSSSDNVEYFQGYSKPYFSGEGLEAKDVAGIAEGSVGIIGKGDVTLHQITATDTTKLKESFRESLDMAFKMGLNQLRQIASGSKASQGADSQEEEKDNTIATVESSLCDLENHLNEGLGFVAQFKGIENYKAGACLSKKISKEDWTTWISLYTATRDLLRRIDGMDAAVAQKAIEGLNFPEKLKADLLKEAAGLKQVNDELGQDGDVIDSVLNGKKEEQSDQTQAGR